ncbi:MAG: c-type cytochrome, partial [Burkholderiaceae bacterium]
NGARSGLLDPATRLARAQTDTHAFHRDPQRTGWNAYETTLTPERVSKDKFGLIWESAQLDGVDGQPPRLYASPLYVDQVRLSAGEHKGKTFPIVIAATNTGFVYAINAFRTRGVPPGTILWRMRLGTPCGLQPAPLDGIPTGVLSTPVIDAKRQRIYVTHCDPVNRWQAYALDLASGDVIRGWPVRLDEATLNAVNKNASAPVAPTRRFDFRVQRGALNLSPDGAWLYVVFGETETGWTVAVDTARARVASAFASQATPHRGAGGVWGAGGPAVDASGNVFVVTGTGYNGYIDRAHDWTQSVLMLSHSAAEGFVLRGTYTPFNHCATAKMDIDLGSGGAMLLPDLDASSTATPRLMVVGGKQGNAYLIDRARMPGRLDRRSACSEDSSSDASLLPPNDQPQFGRRGPLNVFGPYSENDAALDVARGRSVPAYFRDADGKSFVFVTGSTKKEEGSPDSVAPSLARLEVVTAPGKPAYLRVARREMLHAFENPGSPFVTSNGTRDAIVWVLDENARRSALLTGANSPKPVLYAFDAMTLALLWKSEPGELFTSGKYNEPAFARGTVFVGTDRIQAFGLNGRRVARSADAAIAPAVEKSNAAPRDAEALYERRCAVCHDHPQGNVPPRELIARRPQQRIIETLTHGAMRPFAEGFSADEIEAIARYLQ